MAMVGELVWIPDSLDAFVLAEVTDATDKNLTVSRMDDQQVLSVPLDKALPAHRKQDLEGITYNDNTQLVYLHGASLLQNLRLRYAKDEIYTFTAHILTAVNPFKPVPIYDNNALKQYRGRSIGTEPPHVFALADYAYRSMKSGKISQSIIVSGESGAGKTENSKYIMKYLTALGKTDDDLKNLGGLEKTVLQTNPVLESFGNAKTTRNKNSSRFGKFIEIHFDAQAVLCGASISHYLLEKSRVVLQNAKERNYHVFYELCAGAPDKMKADLKLVSADKFKILATTTTVEGVDDKAMFGVLIQAMNNIGMSEQEKNDVFRTIAAVLHIGNLEFADGDKGGSAVKNKDGLKTVATLLGVTEGELEQSLTMRLMSQAGKKNTVIRKPLKREDSALTASALGKALYKTLFDWIVMRVNKALPFKGGVAKKSVVLSSGFESIEDDDSFYIGVLDIAGFEYFEHNSYEQFCINFCNEKLQAFFNEKVLKQEQEIYEKEGIRVPPIRYLSNDDCIEMIEDSRVGIFSILDESAKGPKASDKAFGAAVHEKYVKHPKLADPKKAPLKSNQKLNKDEGFVVRHYAGAVCYETVGFLEKNNDALTPDLEELLRSSTVPFIVDLTNLSPEDNAQKGKLSLVSVGSKFKKQLKELLGKLNNTKSHFIRCIKPNLNLKPAQFDGVDVIQQLHCQGMMEVLELMQKGYPSRTDFNTLYNMYRKNMPAVLQSLDPRTFCEALLYALDTPSDDYKFGLTKVFFRAGKYALLDQITRADEETTKLIVRKVMRWLIIKRWRKAMFAAIASIKLMKKIRVRLNARIVATTMARAYLSRAKYVPLFQKQKEARVEREIEEQKRRERELLEQKAREAAERERKRLEELKWMEENRERLAQEAERLRKEQAEIERRRRVEEQERLAEEEARLREQQEQLQVAADELKRREIEFADEERRLREEEERLEQEQRDNELAVRLARDTQQEANIQKEVEEAVPDVLPLVMGPNGINLTKYSFNQLREIVNHSKDVDLLQACRAEFQRRLQAHNNWKKKYQAAKPTPAPSAPVATSMSTVLQQSTAMPKAAPAAAAPPPAATAAPAAAPAAAAAAAPAAAAAAAPAAAPLESRYFRIPFTRPGQKGKAKKAGLWWGHFEGQRIKRQLEIHPHTKPVMLLAGMHDKDMCDLSLNETGLAAKPGAEIAKSTFDVEWNRCLHLLGKQERAAKIIDILEESGF